jgi:CRP-like cAMP-binding protein
VQPLEAALGTISIFSKLRPDEVGRIAQRFTVISLASQQRYQLDGSNASARAIIVVSGCLDLSLDDPVGRICERMFPGDRYGDTALLTGCNKALSLTASKDSVIALMDRAGLAAILGEFPVVALPLVAELASELRARNDQVRQLFELQSEGLARRHVASAVKRLRQLLVVRSVTVRRMSTTGLFRRLVVEHDEEPPFWMFVGFLLGLLGARIVVHLILKYKLEKQLFALVAGNDPNPVHIHHYNYGLLVVALVGLVAVSPRTRAHLRTLALAFGIGCGLIFDEFALFWDLNPDYSQGLSLISSAIAGSILVQLVYFRKFWRALLERFVPAIGGK